MSNDKNTASLGFEQKIWEAADTLRGNLNAAEYEVVVLGLIFFHYNRANHLIASCRCKR